MRRFTSCGLEASMRHFRRPFVAGTRNFWNCCLVRMKDLSRENDLDMALSVAVGIKDDGFMLMLLENGANVNEMNGHGGKGAALAIIKRNRKLAELLLNKGATIDEKDDGGNMAPGLAVRGGDMELIRLLLRKVNERDRDRKTEPHLLAKPRMGIRSWRERLLSEDVDVNAKDKDGKTALHLVAENVNKELAERLLKEGADVNAKDKDGKTALHIVWPRRARTTAHGKIAQHLVTRASEGACVNTVRKSPRRITMVVARWIWRQRWRMADLKWS